MNDRAEGAIADAWEAVQRQVNRADNVIDQVTTFTRDRPITTLLMAIGVGYLPGKVT